MYVRAPTDDDWLLGVGAFGSRRDAKAQQTYRGPPHSQAKAVRHV
jgi:hypothetical protein